MKRLFLSVCLLAVWIPALLAGNSHISGTFAIGNGRVCVYGSDADLTGLFGPTYSTPTLLSATLLTECKVATAPEKLSGVWNHTLTQEGSSKKARLQDFVSRDGNFFVREFKTGIPLSFRLDLLPEKPEFRSMMEVSEDEVRGATSAWRIHLGAGVPFYSSYSSASEQYALLVTTGGVRLEATDDKAIMTLSADGNGSFVVVFADSKESLSEQMSRVRLRSLGRVCRQSLRFWRKTQRDLPKIGKKVLSPAERKQLDSTLKMVSECVLAQQDEGGGILAGKNYHMAYVRDQYGNSRGLLAMGHLDRAKSLLDFYFRIWQKYGLIHNAQPMGVEGPFHCHEDDNTEITGYLVVQAMDYLRRSGDSEFVERIMPMLHWAVKAQQGDIIDGMLPFNGDETYIAGGIIPRSVMYHGSAEATLLFIEGSRNLLEFLESHPSDIWTSEELEALKSDVGVCSSSYRENFFVDGKLFINNPLRENKVVYPATRPGVCLYPGAPLAHYPTTYHFKGNLYFCEDCMRKDTVGVRPQEPQRYSIPSAFLFPIYIDARLFSDKEKIALLEEVVGLYKRTGRIDERNIVLGYDYGLFLYALARYNHPLAGEIYHKMMDLRDSVLVWWEYYVDGVPYNTPCRPWESSINIAAALMYAGG